MLRLRYNLWVISCIQGPSTHFRKPFWRVGNPMEFFTSTVKFEALIFGPKCLKKCVQQKSIKRVKRPLVLVIRSGSIFNLCGAPPPDLTASLWSAVARHDPIPSIGNFTCCTIISVIICTLNATHIRSLQRANYDINDNSVLCVLLTSAHNPCV